MSAAPDRAGSLRGEQPNQHLGGQRVEVRIAPEDAGDRLDRALQRHLPDLSRSRLKQLILDGRVASGGPGGGKVLRDPAQRASPGADRRRVAAGPEAAEPEAQSIALDIRFEDAHLIVIDKPAGMVVHPAPGNPEGTLVNALLAHCGPSLAGIGGVRRPGIVHRLDKDTSGLLVAAKTEAAHRALAEDFAARRIERAYSAVVWGVPLPASGEIAGNIGRSAVNRKKMAVVAETRGKPAVTRYRVERRFGSQGGRGRAARMPAVDRPHAPDPRASRAYRPFGDRRSGLRRARRAARSPASGRSARKSRHFRARPCMRGCSALSIRRPARRLRFESPLPADMARLISNLELL